MEDSLGQQIHKNRKKKRYSQAELSDLMGVSQKTIISWEKDKVIPHPTNVSRLEKILGVQFNEKSNAKGNMDVIEDKKGSEPTPQEEWYKQIIENLVRQNGENMSQYRVRTDSQINGLSDDKNRLIVEKDQANQERRELFNLLAVHLKAAQDAKK